MEQDPYQAPGSVVADREGEIVVPESVLRDIRSGWITGVISGSITLIFAAISTFVTPVLGFSAFEFGDVALVFGLTYGVYRRSRICAVLLLAYFVLAKLYLLQAGAALGSLPVALVFAYFFARAALATFRYHKLAKA